MKNETIMGMSIFIWGFAAGVWTVMLIVGIV